MRRLHRLQPHQRRGASVLRCARLPRDTLQGMGNRGQESRGRRIEPADTDDLLERVIAAILAADDLQSFSEEQEQILINP